MFHRFLFAFFIFIVTANVVTADEFDRWRVNNPLSEVRVAHHVWDEILARYVVAGDDGVNRFDYANVSDEHRAQLNDYITSLEKITVTELAATAQFAYWINLYNAVTVRVILDHYPLASIRDIKFKWYIRGPWKKKLVTLAGDYELSLDNIEHDIVRPIFGDARAHYVLNCAALGCPNLRRQAYTRDNLEAQLTAAAHEFINHPRAINFADDKVTASSLYDWYADDFGANQTEILAHISRYASPELQQRLATVKRINDYEYDWSLNAP